MSEPVYRPLRRRTWWLKWLLYGWIALSAVLALPRALVLAQSAGALMDFGGAPHGGTAYDLLAGVQAIALLSAMLAFCFWIYRANANLHVFNISDIHSPGWAVGSYFIPVASLWMGYEVMKDIWNNSGPPESDLDGKGWLLPVWWFSWIAKLIISNVLVRLESSFGAVNLAAMGLAEQVFNLVAGAALIAIVTRIDVAQQQQESLSVF